MADDFVKTLLHNWDHKDLVPVFEVCEINESSLKTMTIDQIIKFVPLQYEKRNHFIDKLKSFNNFCIVASLPISNEHVDHCTEKNKGNIERPALAELTNFNTKRQCADEIDTDVPASKNLVARIQNYPQYYYQMLRNKRLYKLLDEGSGHEGKIILLVYAERQVVLRDVLCRIIISHEMGLSITSSNPYSISHRLNALADEVVELFPSEVKSLYFKPAISFHDGTKKSRSNLSGLLRNEYYNYRNWLGTSCKLLNFAVKPIEKPDAVKEVIDISDLTINNNEVLTLEKQIDLAEKWKLTYDLRHGKDALYLSASDLLKKYKILETRLAPTLITIDFKKKCAQATSPIWIETQNKLEVFCQSQYSEITEKPNKKKRKTVSQPSLIDTSRVQYAFEDYNNLFVVLEFVLNKDIDIVDRQALSLTILPVLIKYTVKPKPQVKWKPTVTDTVRSFICHIKDHDELIILKREKTTFYAQVGLNLQPFVVFCGYKQLTCYHVVLGETVYDFETALYAVDFCFKLFFSLRLEYPFGCPHAWSFIQLYIYKLEKEKKTVANKAISEFIIELDKISAASA